MDESTGTAMAEPLTLRVRLRRAVRGRFRLYMLPGYGLAYRGLNRLGHRLHLHYMPPRIIERDTLRRCAWCGVSHVTKPMQMPASVDNLCRVRLESRQD